MTKSELIEYLEGYEDDQEIYIQHTAGDYWKTQLASPLIGVEESRIKHSDYHNQDVIDIENESDDEDSDMKIILIINQKY